METPATHTASRKRSTSFHRTPAAGRSIRRRPRTVLRSALVGVSLGLLAMGTAACGEGDDPSLPQGSGVTATTRASTCGGFAVQSKTNSPMSYCAAEVLNWQYNALQGNLTLRNNRAMLNCCGDHSQTLTRENGVLVLREVDAPEGGKTRCRCECAFDFEAIVKQVAPGLLRLRVERLITDATSPGAPKVLFDGTIDLDKVQGVETLDPTSTAFCDDGQPQPQPQPQPLPQAATFSLCGGFAAAKTNAPPATDYCANEVLTWRHDPQTGRLIVSDNRVPLNCCGDHALTASLEKGVYVLRETDAPEAKTGGRCFCLCVFDFQIAIDNVPAKLITVKLMRDVLDDNAPEQMVWTGQIDLSKATGSVIVDTTDVGATCDTK